MFWSSGRIKDRVEREKLIHPFREEQIDCAACHLAVGDEVYVSPDGHSAEPASVTIRKLKERECFAIPPGQFAFLVTRERVRVPRDALAFISVRAKVKFRGLVNVSGFHVDPGYDGQLTFAVFNAGPASVHLKEGDPVFLIWYADLDSGGKAKDGDTVPGIATDVIAGIAGQVPSYAALAKRIDAVGERMHGIEKQQSAIRAVLLLVAGALLGWMLP